MQKYISALLSNIAYLKDENYSIRPDGSITLFGGLESGLNQAEIDFFNNNFKIESQKNGTNGFSAMKIVALKSSNFGGFSAGDVTIAYRGTEINEDDLVTDTQMALLAITQLATNTMSNSAELNKLLVAVNKFGANDFDLWSDSVKSQLSQAADYFNEQKLLNKNLNVVGHSLGGYLANSVTIIGDNYNSINETTTFNAPGFNMGTIVIIEIKKAINDLINTDTTNLSSIEINDLIYEINKLSTKLGTSTFNDESLKKIHTLYSSTGINFTSNETVMFSPVPKIPVYTTPQTNPIFNHGIGFLQESTALYDILNSIMKGNSADNYNKITKMLDNYRKTTSNETLAELTLHISKYLGIDTNNTFDVFNHFLNMSNEQLNTLNYDELNYSNYDKSSAYVYALINLVPIVISNELDAFQNTVYDIAKYSKENLLNRFILFERYTHLNTIENFITKIVTIPTMNVHENYKLIYDYNENIDLYTFVDEKNKIIMTNDFTSYRNITNNEFNFGGDLNNNIKTTYFKNNQSTLFVNTLNNIVYDTTLDDYISLNKGSTNLDLSYGSDTINIEISNGAKINNLTIKDGGIGDLFIFNGGQLDDNIIGTQYNDNIIGNNGNDKLNGLNGDDKIYGGNGDDSLIGGGGSNYLEGGDGDDTLNDHGSMYEYNDVRGDTLNAGKGINTIYGTGYGDTYLYSKQDGYTTINENNTNSGFNYIDRLVFDSTIQGIEVSLFKNLYELIIAINGIKKIFIIDYFNNYNYLEEIHFTDGHNTTWYTDDILSRYTDLDEKLLAGSSADDNLQGGDDNEDLDGRDGNDTIKGGKGNDVIYGGDGNDTIYGEAGNDTLNGNEGDDIIYGGDGVDIINGDNGDDKLYGDSGDDFIYGGDGIDIIYGGLDNDFINGNNGDDKLNGDAGNDTIFGGEGNDTINGNVGDDTLNGENGSDIIYGGDGNDTLSGGNDNDTLNGDAGNDVIYGGNGIDTINGGLGDDIIYGDNDNDIIDGGAGNDEIHGGDGNDKINGGLGNDTIYGDDGDDSITINGTIKTEFDKIYGGNGADTISNAINNTYIRAGNDDDKIFTSGDNVDIDAENGNDIIYMNTGSGYLKGGNGSDNFVNNSNPSSSNYTIEGGAGDDTINMTRGHHNIIYNNGDGNDTIIINGTNVTSQADVVRIHGYSKSSITSENLFLTDTAKSLKIQLGSNDSLTLVNFLTSKTSMYNLNSFQFDDGTLTSEDLMNIFTHINGTENNDKFYDTIFSDVFDMSGGGNDFVSLKSGFDTVYSGESYTDINISSSNNIIYSGSGDDKITLTGNYSNVFNLKESNNGNDLLFGNGSSKTIINLSSNVYISDMILNGKFYFYTFGWSENSSINLRTDYLNNQIIFNVNGSPVTDLNSLRLNGNNDGNYLKILTTDGQTAHGNGGNDKIYGNIGNDFIYGDDGEDYIEDKYGNNTIYGGADNDRILTGAGNDTIYGGSGNDSISSGSGIDTVYGGDGDDYIGGSLNPDSKYYGGSGNDTYNIGGGYISDNSGLNTLMFGAGYRDKVDIISNGNGFNVLINDIHTISYNGEINRIERHSMPPSGYATIVSLVGNEINRLFEIKAALESETDTSKITEMNREISNLWKYDQP
jgi:Ca2+-binding RTX toxin-like protein